MTEGVGGSREEVTAFRVAVDNCRERIDDLIRSQADNWRLERMPIVDRTILRLAIYELKHQATPAPIVIDEAVELARQFSGDESVAFINGVLDAVRRESA